MLAELRRTNVAPSLSPGTVKHFSTQGFLFDLPNARDLIKCPLLGAGGSGRHGPIILVNHVEEHRVRLPLPV